MGNGRFYYYRVLFGRAGPNLAVIKRSSLILWYGMTKLLAVSDYLISTLTCNVVVLMALYWTRLPWLQSTWRISRSPSTCSSHPFYYCITVLLVLHSLERQWFFKRTRVSSLDNKEHVESARQGPLCCQFSYLVFLKYSPLCHIHVPASVKLHVMPLSLTSLHNMQSMVHLSDLTVQHTVVIL